jgi:hypothetical protein
MTINAAKRVAQVAPIEAYATCSPAKAGSSLLINARGSGTARCAVLGPGLRRGAAWPMTTSEARIALVRARRDGTQNAMSAPILPVPGGAWA